jgi:hypothetical protein
MVEDGRGSMLKHQVFGYQSGHQLEELPEVALQSLYTRSPGISTVMHVNDKPAGCFVLPV